MKGIASLEKVIVMIYFRKQQIKWGFRMLSLKKILGMSNFDYLFNKSPWQNSFAFKGGTSLAKAFHLINRFSEDIDII